MSLFNGFKFLSKISKLTVIIFAVSYIHQVFGFQEVQNLKNPLELNFSLFSTDRAENVNFYNKYSQYIESNDHILFGYGTPVYIAKIVDSSGIDSDNIDYDRLYYPIPGQKLEFSKRIKRAQAEINHNETDKLLTKNVSNQKVDVLYPEILVVTDYETYKAYNEDVISLATYVAAFWNGVDLRFREIKDPQIRLNIAGLVISTDFKTEPYLQRNSSNNNYFDNLALTLDRVGKYFKKKIKNFDVVAVMTRQDLRPDNLNGPKKGYSFEESACKGSSSVMLVKDAGGFEGIHDAAYELGHVFGSPHDVVNDESENFPKKACVLIKSNSQHLWNWPECSRIAMQNYLRSVSATCLRNKPDVIIPRWKKLPGKLLNRDEQCGKIFPEYVSYQFAGFPIDASCDILKCRKCIIPSVLCDYETHRNPPAEGSSCGQGFICLNGECVEDLEIFD